MADPTDAETDADPDTGPTSLHTNDSTGPRGPSGSDDLVVWAAFVVLGLFLFLAVFAASCP